MSNKIEYNEIRTFHPGYYIAEIIEDMEISQAEFATRMGTSGKTLSTLVNGQSNLTNDLAQKIATMFGTSLELWLNLQKIYDEKILEIEQNKLINEQTEIMRMIDYSYFVKVLGLPETKSISEKISNLCSALIVSDLRTFTKPDFLLNFRTGVSKVQNKNVINAQIWVQTALNLAKRTDIQEFSETKLKNKLPVIREMTLQPESQFLPKLTDIFADCGVSFVLLPHLKNSGINGAVKWYGQNQVLLAMNDRRFYADTFWFSLFHEIKHVLQQKVKKVFVNSDMEEMGQLDLDLELEADEFAQDYLIPKEEYIKFATSKYISDDQIVEFSNKIGIHPGIVADRLQHDGIIPQNRCLGLKKQYRNIT